MNTKIVLALLPLVLCACGGNPSELFSGVADPDTGLGGAAGSGGALPEGGTGGGALEAGTGGTGPESDSGGQDAAAGASGTGPETGAEADAPEPPACPADDMVKVDGGYCIDKTEVTRGAYSIWLATNPSVSAQNSWCSWNTTFVPSCEWPPGAKGQHPVVCVDFCDASAFCKGIGKRLCGKIGGGENGYGDFADSSKSQWFNACSAGGTLGYPYGDAYQPTVCNGQAFGVGSTVEAGSLHACKAAAGAYDMSGNVLEWEDACDGASGGQDKCRFRGGSFSDYGNATELRCDYGTFNLRDFRHAAVGFRCCS